LDKHGWLPKKLIDASPFHASFLISNLASINTNHIYHHCYDFGTTSVTMTMGNAREVARRNRDEVFFERCLPLGVVLDDRICSGKHYALAFERFQEYLRDPALLETPPQQVLTEA
nr:2-oxoglutarate dehydrogenase [bacterium]